MQARELDVLGTEVVPPLRDAVRLVDREERQLAALDELVEEAHEALGEQAFGSDVDEVEFAAHQAAFGVDDGLEVER